MHDGYLTICGHELPVGTVAEFVGFALCLLFVGVGLLLLRAVGQDEIGEDEIADLERQLRADGYDVEIDRDADEDPYRSPRP